MIDYIVSVPAAFLGFMGRRPYVETQNFASLHTQGAWDLV